MVSLGSGVDHGGSSSEIASIVHFKAEADGYVPEER